VYVAGNKDDDENAVDRQDNNTVDEVVGHRVDATVKRRIAPPSAALVVAAAERQVERTDVCPGVRRVHSGQRQPPAVLVEVDTRPVVDADDPIQRVNPRHRAVFPVPLRAGHLTCRTLFDRYSSLIQRNETVRILCRHHVTGLEQ